MKIIAFLLVAILSICGFASVRGTCPKECTRIYQPVCAELRRFGPDPKCTFSNDCMFRSRVCHYRNERWTKLHEGECNRQSLMCAFMTE